MSSVNLMLVLAGVLFAAGVTVIDWIDRSRLPRTGRSLVRRKVVPRTRSPKARTAQMASTAGSSRY